jgi:hypothetical protein
MRPPCKALASMASTSRAGRHRATKRRPRPKTRPPSVGTIRAREGSIVSSAESLWVCSSPKNTACSSLAAKLMAATTKPANAPTPAPRKRRLDSRARTKARRARGTSNRLLSVRAFFSGLNIVTLGRPQEPAATACPAKASTRLDPRAGSCVANAPGTLRARFNCGVAYAHTVHATPAFHGRCVNPRGVAFGAFRCSKLATLPASGLNLSHVLN